MKKVSLYLAAVASLMAVSCVKADFSETNTQPQRNLVPLVLNSGEKMDEPQAKTSLNGNEVHWTSDDVIAVVDKANYVNEFKAVSTEGSKAVFEGFVESGTTDFYAVYPYSSVVSADASNLTINLPSTQNPKVGTFAEELNISVASGQKTPGNPEVSGLKFHNLCGLIAFTIPERLQEVSQVTFTANNRVLAGNLSVSKSDMLTVASVSSGSNSLTMSGSFSAGSTFYFVAVPGDISGFSIQVTTMNGATFTRTSVKTISVAAGALKYIGTIDFKSEPSAVAEHTLENGVLTGTEVTFNLGLPSKMEEYVENVKVSMYNPNTDEEVRNLTWDNPGTSSVLAVVGDNKYLPQGDYTVRCTYTVNGIEEVKTFVAEVPEPDFIPTATAYTSYSKYLQNQKDAANACQPETIYDIRYSANISDEILAKYPMTLCEGSIYDASGSAISPISSNSDQSMLKKSTFYSQAELKVNEWARYTAKAKVTFDGKTVTSDEKELYITGLPYDSPNFYNTSVSIASTSSAAYNQWAYSGNVEYWKSHGYQVIYWYLGGVTAGVMFSPEFKIPSATKTNYYISACYFTTGVGNPNITIYSGATTNFTKSTSNGYDLKRINTNSNPNEEVFTNIPHALTLNPSSRLSIGTDEQKDGNAAQCWVTIRSLAVDYDNIQ